eukprot:gene41061-50808_t
MPRIPANPGGSATASVESGLRGRRRMLTTRKDTMNNSNSRRSPAPLALAVALCFTAPSAALAQAQAVAEVLAPVVVTGARFDSDPSLLPIGATVISAAEIRRSGASDVNQAIRKIGGVLGHQSLDGSPDFALDLRGFGTNSSQNMVVMLDGVRLSENELTSAILSTIPVDSVERIEITRGGSSVLFGDGATGGVIQIVTKRPGARTAGTHGSVFGEVGQFGLREGRAALTHGVGNWAFDLSGGALDTDNYRDNNDFKSRSVNAGAQLAFTDGRAGVRLSSTRQDSRFAGSLSQAQFDANPRRASTPKDFGALDSDSAESPLCVTMPLKFFSRAYSSTTLAKRSSSSMMRTDGSPAATSPRSDSGSATVSTSCAGGMYTTLGACTGARVGAWRV